MTEPQGIKDLVVLAACKDGEYAMRGILSRERSLGIRPIVADYYVHPEHDCGVFKEAHSFLRPFCRTHRHALVLLDWEGSGQEKRLTASQMEQNIAERLQSSGWAVEQVTAIAICPELEAWAWSDSPQVDAVLGWTNRLPSLRSWLSDPARAFLFPGQVKPARPKEALNAALRELRRPRSSSLYRELAENVSLARCADPAFAKLRRVLRDLFGATSSQT